MSDNIPLSEYYRDEEQERPPAIAAYSDGRAPHVFHTGSRFAYSNLPSTGDLAFFGLASLLPDPGASSSGTQADLDEYFRAVDATNPVELESDLDEMSRLQNILYFDQSTTAQTQLQHQELEDHNTGFALSPVPSTTQNPARSSNEPAPKRKKRKHKHAGNQVRIRHTEGTGTRKPSLLFALRYDNRPEIEIRFFAALMQDDFFPDVAAADAMLVSVLREMGFCECCHLSLLMQ